MIDIKALLTAKAFQMGVVAGISGTLSAFISYRVTKRRLDKEYREIIDREILEARKFYSALNKRDAYASPELVMKEVGLDNAVKALNNYQGLASVVETDEEKELEATTFYPGFKAENEPVTQSQLNYKRLQELSTKRVKAPIVEENEHSTRRPLMENSDTTAPYIITVEEFLDASNADARASITLTYYTEDDVLADDKDIPIDNIDETIGTENLAHFGEDSGDGNIVYVRNDHLDVDFEVIRHQGNYAELVHGIAKEPRRRARKFRGDDG